MKLKILNLIISGRKQFMADAKDALFSSKSSKENTHAMYFDSEETIKRLLTANKLQILMAIARCAPESINQLAKILDREYPHVLKDCNTLETMGFIKYEKMKGARKQFIPKLVFDYDIIRIKSNLEEIYPISLKSNNLLLQT